LRPPPENTHNRAVTPEQLSAFATEIRRECDIAPARFATVDPDALPPRLRRRITRRPPRLVIDLSLL